jgi:hypothetical protein
MAAISSNEYRYNIKIGNHNLKIGANFYIGAVGASFVAGAKTKIGFAYGIGGEIIIEWD